jgi:hypothetical protein
MFRRALAGLVMVLATAPAFAAGAVADSNVLKITLDQAQIAKLPAGTSTVIIGNPMIADVTPLKSGGGTVLTGKGYGQTNLIALDADGNVLDEKQIVVEPTRRVLVVQRGNARASYSCNPVCMPTVQLGDDDKVFSETGAQITTRNSLADKPATK